MAVNTDLSVRAQDRSTYVVTSAFTDENGDAVVPKTMTWTLTDNQGSVINSRDGVAVVSPLATQPIALSGEDLDFGDGRIRVFTVEATYDGALGNDLPIRAAARFFIDDLVAVEAT